MNVDRAKKVLEDAHALWAAGDLEGVLRHYTYRMYLRPIMDANETVSSVLDFSYSTGVARARIAIFIRHRQSGHKITATYRQMVTYRADKMCRIDEYHDVAKLSTFWRMAQRDSMADT